MRLGLILTLLISGAWGYTRDICTFGNFGNRSADLGQRQSLSHKLAEMPIQYLGGKMRFYNLSQGIPTKQWSRPCHALLVWQTEFSPDIIPNGQELAWIQYLQDQVHAGKKLLMLENPGFNMDKVYAPGPIQKAYVQLLHSMGLDLKRAWTSDQKPQIIDPRNCLGESPQAPSPRRWFQIQAQNHWQGRCIVQDPSQKHSQAALIWTGPKGTWVSPGAMIRSGTLLNGKNGDAWFQWYVDPFSFFEQALDLSMTPKWEYSIRLGKRIYFAHVDGDGFMNRSQVNPSLWTTQILEDSILKPYPEFPIALSVIGAEIHPKFLGDAHSMERLQKLWKLPQVEASSHTFSHPFVYNEAQKQIFKHSYESYALVLPHHNHNWEYEFKGNTRWLDSIAQSVGKKIRTLQWSGNCLPDVTALKLTREAGLGNINGGDNRYDQNFSSVSGLGPLGLEIGHELQIYTANANETIYSEGWSWQYQGLDRVLESWQRSAKGRTLKPINLYFHFYALEKRESLASFKRIFKWLQTQDLYPIPLSDYTALAQNFYRAQMDSLGPRHWVFSPKQELSTLRLSANYGYPDSKDPNVLGYKRQGHLLYLYLLQAKPTQVHFQTTPPQKILIAESNGDLSQVQSQGSRWSAVFSSWKKGQICWHLPHSNTKLWINGQRLPDFSGSCTLLPASCTQQRCRIQIEAGS